ncbi:hypothetical protein [Rhodococcus sp. BE178]|uniref:hypothetical protein n=1 Tax=Rhodococcus sp. BE178 TaxID=2817737 RepID=UPI003D1B6BE1
MTDTINTYGDPRADAPHEWQRPALEVTPASLRAHADWMRDGGFPITAVNMEDQAARLEAESARDLYLDELAQHAERVIPGAYAWDHDDRGIARHAIEAAFNRLAADGRLLPEGGTVSEAMEKALTDTLDTVLSALGLTAEHVTEGQARDMQSAAWDDGWNACNHWWHDGEVPGEESNNPYLSAPPAASVPDSGPDGTPEKPWKTWQDVPDGVEVASAKYPHLEPTIKVDGRRYYVISSITQADVADLAPFVRVDGDKA